MKRIMFVLLALIGVIFVSHNQAYAYEEPVAGMAVTIEAIGDKPISKAIAYYSTIHHVDSDLVRAVIDGESSGDAAATNHNDNGTHDSGLMQINSINHKWLSDELGIMDFYDQVQNVQAGCYILGLLSAKYDNIHRILMAYNMGEKRTRELWNKGIYSSQYSRRVVEKFTEIREGY